MKNLKSANRFTFLALICFISHSPAFSQLQKIQDFFGSTNKNICESAGSVSENDDVTQAINKMMDKLGANNRYLIKSCSSIDNCQAVFYNEKAYILYNPEFLKGIKHFNFTETSLPKSDDWEALTVLAHEIGHHINQHVVNPPEGASAKDLELEADEFAGYMMYHMGATLEQTQQVMHSSVISDVERPYSTHPTRQKRLAAIEKGYNKAIENLLGLDSDGDGVRDKDDLCPTLPGSATNKGCPSEPPKDTDSDGITDKADTCPSIKGDLYNDGCPTCENLTTIKSSARALVTDYFTDIAKLTADDQLDLISRYCNPLTTTIYNDQTQLEATQIPADDYLSLIAGKNLTLDWTMAEVTTPQQKEDFSGMTAQVKAEVAWQKADKTISHNRLIIDVDFDQLSKGSYGNQTISQISFYEKVGSGERSDDIQFWTNKGDSDLTFSDGDELKLYVRSPKETYIRLIYELADGTKVLMFDNYHIDHSQINKEIKYPETFECAAPYGNETALLYASDTPFRPLSVEDHDGYQFITETVQKLNKGTQRGFKKKKGSGKMMLVRQLDFKTMR